MRATQRQCNSNGWHNSNGNKWSNGKTMAMTAMDVAAAMAMATAMATAQWSQQWKVQWQCNGNYDGGQHNGNAMVTILTDRAMATAMDGAMASTIEGATTMRQRQQGWAVQGRLQLTAQRGRNGNKRRNGNTRGNKRLVVVADIKIKEEEIAHKYEEGAVLGDGAP